VNSQGNDPGKSPDDEPVRVSIYPPKSWWAELRRLGLDENASASAQVVELIDRYLHQSSQATRRSVIKAAAERTKGRRGYVPPKN
jgi:hypothetical protein